MNCGQWVRQSPLQHPVPFLVMTFVTGAMMFDFCFFREQLCLVACPYGRFQSVLLDQNSLIVAYDEHRGEPRGKLTRNASPAGQLPVLGDCINCGNCVTTCPTGIDIRDGLQMECINCTQCIDACNLVMQKIGRQPDLIRYSSQARDQGLKGSLLRPRTLIYPLLLVGIFSAFFVVLLSGKSFDAVVLREPGNPYSLTDDGRVRNLFRLKLTNRSDADMSFSARVLRPERAVLQLSEDVFEVPHLKPDDADPDRDNNVRTFHALVTAPRDVFVQGRANLQLEIENDRQVTRILNFKLIGPFN